MHSFRRQPEERGAFGNMIRFCQVRVALETQGCHNPMADAFHNTGTLILVF